MEEGIDSNELFQNEPIAGPFGEECKPNLDEQKYSHINLEPQTFEEDIKPSISFCDNSDVKIEEFVVKKERDNEFDDFQTFGSVKIEPQMKLNVENNFYFDSYGVKIEYDSSNDNQEINDDESITNFDNYCDDIKIENQDVDDDAKNIINDDCGDLTDNEKISSEQNFKNDEDPRTFNDFVTESADGEDDEDSKGCELLDQLKMQVDGLKGPYRCKYCRKRFSMATNLKRHIKSQHKKEKKEGSYFCSQCEFGFTQAHSLNRHIEEVHKNKRPHFCLNCEISFKRGSDLRRHVAAYHEQNKPHVCLQCNSSFTQAPDLKRHIDAVHNKKRPHVCLLCMSSFARPDSLNRHVRSVHEKKRPHLCLLCKSRFTRPGTLKEHIKSVH